MLLDAHCHVDRFASAAQVLRAAAHANVTTVAVTELPSACQRLAMLLGARRDVRVALGLHPLRAAQASALELRLFDRLVDDAEWIGEVGLDFSRVGAPTRRRQLRVFEHVLGHPRIARKVLSVHSRGAERETVEMLAETRATAVLHWYTGPLTPLDDALAAGMYFSVNPAMLASKSGMRVIRALPHDRVLIETDGPHTKRNGRPAEPCHVPSIATDLAGAWGLSPNEALSLLEGSAKRLIATVAKGGLADARRRRRAGRQLELT